MNNGIFQIAGNDLIEAEEFVNMHINTCWDKYRDVSGALISYTFVPTGITNVAIIECECGEKLTLYSEIDCGFGLKASTK